MARLNDCSLWFPDLWSSDSQFVTDTPDTKEETIYIIYQHESISKLSAGLFLSNKVVMFLLCFICNKGTFFCCIPAESAKLHGDGGFRGFLRALTGLFLAFSKITSHLDFSTWSWADLWSSETFSDQFQRHWWTFLQPMEATSMFLSLSRVLLVFFFTWISLWNVASLHVRLRVYACDSTNTNLCLQKPLGRAQEPEKSSQKIFRDSSIREHLKFLLTLPTFWPICSWVSRDVRCTCN